MSSVKVHHDRKDRKRNEGRKESAVSARRAAIAAFLLLIAGAFLNVAIAWTLYLWAPYAAGMRPGFTREEAARVWHRCWPPGTHGPAMPSPQAVDAGEFVVASNCFLGFGYRIVAVGLRPSAEPISRRTPTTAMGWEICAGWPAFSLWGHKRSDETSDGLIEIEDTWVPVRKLDLPIKDNHLPVVPRWPGFAINTLLYSGILWLLWTIPSRVLRLRRYERGLCPKCGYDLRGTEHKVCPECGSSLSRLASRKVGEATAPG